MADLISIIVPIYNEEKYIKRCIESIICQTYKNIEIILVDDGSKDNSLEICKKMAQADNRIKVIQKENGGASSARNCGIKKSNGKYLTFVDADDWIEKDYIYALYKNLKLYNVDIVKGNYLKESNNKVYGKENFKNLKNRVIKKEDNFISSVLEGGIFTYICGVLIEKNILIKNNINFDEDITYMEDELFWLKIIMADLKIYILDKVIYHYYINNDSISKNIEMVSKNINDVLNVNKKIQNIIDNTKFEEKYILKRKLCTCHFNIIFYLYYIQYKKENTKLKDEIKRLKKDEDFKIIVENTDISLMSLHLKIQYLCVKSNKTNLLILYYKTKKVFSYIKAYIKNKINKRKYYKKEILQYEK